MKKFLLLLIAAGLLSACVSGKRGSEAVAEVYDLGLPPAGPQTASPAGVALEVRMPAWLEGMGIQYRLLYSGSSRLREYGYARWVGMPDDLLEQRLGQRLGVPTVRDGVATPCLLSIDIDQFGQVFSTENDSRGVIHGQARLLSKGRAVIAARPVSFERPAPAPNAQGGVTALTAATDALAAEMAEWLGQLAQAGKTSACGAGR